ncbi:MAG: response regulator [Epsilonproteobacteria bacterium]|nr:response regulator [Campylobacterota bacterium]
MPNNDTLLKDKAKISLLIKLIPMAGVLVVSVVLIFVSIFGISNYFRNYMKEEVVQIKQDAIKHAKIDIEAILNVSKNTRQIIQRFYNKNLMDFVNNGYKIIQHEYNTNPPTQAIHKIADILRILSRKDRPYFVYTIDAKAILASKEVRESLEYQNPKTKNIVLREFISELKEFPEGVFNEWYIKKGDVVYNQIGYAKYFQPLKIFIGSYFSQSQVKQYIYHRISLFFKHSNIHHFSIFTQNKQIIYSNLQDKGFLHAKLAKTGDIEQFTYKDKMYMYTYYDLLNMYIVKEVNLDKINQLIKDVQRNIHHLTRNVIKQFLIAASVVIILILLITLRVIQYIEQIFEKHEDALYEAKEAAERAAKVKSEFLANMSHEIRTPLNAMFGFIKILQDKDLDKESQRYLDIIEKSGENLLNIINDILDFSKIESGKLVIEYVEFNPKEEIEIIYTLFKTKATEKRINLQLEENLKYNIISDPTRIKQVIANLLSNAIKFTPEGKNIFLNVKYNDKSQTLFVEVKDEGIGIPPDKLSHIFEAFTQADTSTTRKFGGTGLGLSISYRLVQLLGGELKVESEVNKGSRFYFEIPATKRGEIKHITKQKVALEDEKFHYHVLLVEDNIANQMFMKVILQKMGMTFDVANDGLEAVEKFKENKYDFILMDENMPNMSGSEATKKIREIEKANNLKPTIIIALSANALTGDKERFLLAGMNFYLSKPLDIEKFKKLLKEIREIIELEKE